MIPLAIPNLSGNEGRYLQDCVETNFVSTVGPFVTRFEEDVAKAAGAKYGVATCSGTAGLHLALTALGVARGDLVILPSFTFIASANAIAHCGAAPWLFDISKESWTLDVELLEKQLHREVERVAGRCVHKRSGRRVAAIMPVYTLGQPADMDGIIGLADEYQLPVVADAAAALGCRYKGMNVGQLADLTVFSFNGNKTITSGGGGMVVGDHEELLRLARHLSTTARVGSDYDHDRVGFNYRLTNLQAAVGCAQIERLNEFVNTKRRLDAQYREAFKGCKGIEFFPAPDWAKSACWFTGIAVVEQTLPAVSEICQRLRTMGIGARKFWKPVHLQSPFKAMPQTSMSVSNDIWRRILTLPCSTHLCAEEQSQVVASVLKVLEH